MSKILTLVLVMLVLTGCETVKGAAQDLQNTANNVDTLAKNSVNPDKNGWNALKKADGWMQKNLW